MSRPGAADGPSACTAFQPFEPLDAVDAAGGALVGTLDAKDAAALRRLPGAAGPAVNRNYLWPCVRCRLDEELRVNGTRGAKKRIRNFR